MVLRTDRQHLAEHRLLRLEADAEVAARELLEVERVLRRQRLVDAELGAQGGARLLR